MSKICGIIGHRRDRNLARRHEQSWRSECTRCGIPMGRSAPGLWTTAPALAETSEFPTHAAISTPHYPGKHPSGQAVLDVSGVPPTEYLAFPHEFAATVMAVRSPASASREHYVARSLECRRLAAEAGDPSIELIHLDMATRYEILARQTEEELRPLRSVK